MRRVVLFYPSLINGDESPTLYTALPLSLVALAAPLRAASFEVEILDERLHIYTEEEIGKQLEGAVLVGISAITSYQIVNGLRFARSVRRLAPHIPIVWGGWHPTLMPMETLRHPLVDAVAIGQGEEILPQLAQRARDRLPFKGVPNILYKDTGGQVVINPRIEMARYPVYGSPAGGYTAVDLERYIHPQWGHRRVVGYESSRGCPYRCAFCSIGAVYKRHWHGLPAETVARDIARLRDEYGIDAVHFFDNNFFLDVRRAARFAEGLIESSTCVAWDGTVVAQQFVRFSPQTIERLRRGGLFRVIVGGESGDEEVLKKIHKAHTNRQILETARRCKEYGLMSSFSFMVGFPWNPEQDTARTIDLIGQIRHIDKNSEILLFVFSPYLGTPLYDVARQAGMAFPDTLEGWANFTYDKANTPWMPERLMKRIDRYLRFFGTKQQSADEESFFRGFR